MISRVAESCFWLNRYLERVEVLARLLDVNFTHQLDVEIPDRERWLPLVIVSGQEEDYRKRVAESALGDPEKVQQYLVWSDENPASLYSSLYFARENARTIRETISLEMWEALNQLWVWLGERAARRLYRNDRHAFYVHFRTQCHLFHGAAQATMLHEDPFEFMRLGTALERAGQTARVLDIKYHRIGPTSAEGETPAEAAEWLATLRSCSGVEPFFKRASFVLSGHDVADFLLFDRTFPRSVLHNLLRARNFLELVRPARPTAVGARSEAVLAGLLERMSATTIEEVLAEGLHGVLTWIVGGTVDLGVAIHADFFDPAPVAVQGQSQGPGAGQGQSQP